MAELDRLFIQQVTNQLAVMTWLSGGPLPPQDAIEIAQAMLPLFSSHFDHRTRMTLRDYTLALAGQISELRVPVDDDPVRQSNNDALGDVLAIIPNLDRLIARSPAEPAEEPT